MRCAAQWCRGKRCRLTARRLLVRVPVQPTGVFLHAECPRVCVGSFQGSKDMRIRVRWIGDSKLTPSLNWSLYFGTAIRWQPLQGAGWPPPLARWIGSSSPKTLKGYTGMDDGWTYKIVVFANSLCIFFKGSLMFFLNREYIIVNKCWFPSSLIWIFGLSSPLYTTELYNVSRRDRHSHMQRNPQRPRCSSRRRSVDW